MNLLIRYSYFFVLINNYIIRYRKWTDDSGRENME